MMKKKKLKFDVKLSIQDLSSIPLLNGVIYCKTRLINGGVFSELTPRGNVVSHCVKWGSHFAFSCKLSASPSTGILETCICRISVRKEVKGGKNYDKMGYVDLNLAEYAGCGNVSCRYILEAYKDSKQHRQDNSILKVSVCMALTYGDPLFKPQVSLNDHRLTAGESPPWFSSNSAGISGPTTRTSIVEDTSNRGSFQFEHHRSPSSGSAKHTIPPSFHNRSASGDKRSSGLSINHSKQPSTISGDSGCVDTDMNHISPLLTRPNMRSSEFHKRIDETRVDADDIIDQLVEGANLTLDTSNADEGIDMSLFLDSNGSSTMSKVDTRRRRDISTPQHIEDRFKTL